jgi:hypothetical protein
VFQNGLSLYEANAARPTNNKPCATQNKGALPEPQAFTSELDELEPPASRNSFQILRMQYFESPAPPAQCQRFSREKVLKCKTQFRSFPSGKNAGIATNHGAADALARPGSGKNLGIARIKNIEK